ncbi:MAG: ABC transporter ATP-binding protein [Lactobacillaceae bacterium]|jgi:multiple sugar transport system ATP-binding protein|nr:ABC transporter ATP-binding protein [Lactobacillaceae bacterium]
MKISVQNLSLEYVKGQKIIDDVSFEIQDGTLTTLLGPSGSGKSTILNMIAGLLAPTSGQVFFGEKDVTKLDVAQRNIGMVFQNYALYPNMTVRQNIDFPLKIAKVAKADRQQEVIRLAQIAHVEDQLDKKPAELSGGQQQRVAIARALAKKPNVLLLDEPLSNLDAKLRNEMREDIRRIQQETKVTTIFVTHDQNEAMHISDMVMLLSDGVIQQFAKPRDLYERPANLFVAKFIGDPEINLIKSDLVKGSDLVGIRPDVFNAYEGDVELTIKVLDIQKYNGDTQIDFEYAGSKMVATNVSGVNLESDKLFVNKKDLLGFDKNGRLM